MHFLERLLETVLMEAAALTKGSQRVMNDKKLVAGLADAMRDDVMTHPQNFPPGSKKSFQTAPDEELAHWFLENLDKIEREGYEGTIYSRDGVYSDWIVRRYIAGSHNWEDITGVMNMNMRDWTLLKNRNLLDPNHRDIPKFNSVRDLGSYMSTHYADKLEKIRDAAKNAARNKMAKNVKLVDNDDYRIYTTLNRAAGCALGLGTQWCTANSNNPKHFHTYSNKAMLFQVFPYAKEEKNGDIVNMSDEDGKKILNDKQKFQFDAGGLNFMDITDNPVTPAIVAQKFPYLYTDLSKALKTNKDKMEQAFKDLSADPTLQGEDYKIKTYEIDNEIKKLHKFIDRGYFTDEVRPKTASTSQAAGEKPQELPAPQQPEGNPQMENVDKDVAAMLNSLKKYDRLVESIAPVLGMVTLGEKKGGKPEWLEDAEKKAEKKEGKGGEDESDSEGGEIDESEDLDEKWGGDTHLNPKKKGMFKGKNKSELESELSHLKKSGPHKKGSADYTKEKELNFAIRAKSGWKEGSEVDNSEMIEEQADPEVLEWMKRFASLGNMKGYGK